MAEEIPGNPLLPEEVARYLQAYRGEFLFGSTAADVQVISGQTREATHFFRLPIQAGDQPAWGLLLRRYPHLARVHLVPGSQAAFLAGYLCHLQADWIWNQEIFAPAFGPGCSWGTFHDRLYYHNVLRAYLDRSIVPVLGAGTAACLCQVKPHGWLPFVEDGYLTEWRDFLSKQLGPGATTDTVEVFSSRQGISAPEYYALLESETRMQREVFAHMPLAQVERYRHLVLGENIQLVSAYLTPGLQDRYAPIEESAPGGRQS